MLSVRAILEDEVRFSFVAAAATPALGSTVTTASSSRRSLATFSTAVAFKRVQLLEKSEEQQARAKGIDLTRHPAGMTINQRETVLGELRIAFPLGAAQPVLDIGSGLAFAQRSQMIGRGHPLPQLFEPRAAEHGAELRLPEQEALQRHRLVDDDVGEHPELFERFEGQVLRLVDDQQHASAVALLGQHEVVDALQ